MELLHVGAGERARQLAVADRRILLFRGINDFVRLNEVDLGVLGVDPSL